MYKIIFPLFFLFYFSVEASLSKPIHFVVDDELGRDNVSFTSDAPIELIVGRTSSVKGKIKRPELIFQKLTDIAIVSVDIFAVSANI